PNSITRLNGSFKKRRSDGRMNSLAFIKDPDGLR
ncbi:hypothetical protein PSYPI_49397, partial [Pseudomonas syringae pv. pisi str. 1704B]